MTEQKNIHRMLFAHANLKGFLGEDPKEWFGKQGIEYIPDQIGFHVTAQKGQVKDRFDFPFPSEAIGMVVRAMTQAAAS